MPEIRTDPLTGLRVIVAGDGPTPQFAVAAPPPIDPALDPFAAGNEAATAPEGSSS